MLKFKSLTDATRAAAEFGGSLDADGRVINPTGARLGVVRQQPEPEPAPAAPAPAEPSRLEQTLQAQIAVQAQKDLAITRVLAELVERASAPPPAAAEPPPCARRRVVSFEVERNADGLISRITPVFEDAP